MDPVYVDFYGWRLDGDGALLADVQSIPGPDDDPSTFGSLVLGTIAIPLDPAKTSLPGLPWAEVTTG